MSAQNITTIDPMREGHPEAFTMPRTLPAWDLSDLFASPEMPHLEVNGTAFEKNKEYTDARRKEA